VTLSPGPTRLGPATALIAAAVAACSIGDVGPALPPLPPNPPDMAVVNSEAARIFGVLKLPGSPELSRLRPAHPTALSEWIVCLRSDADDLPRNYALFLRNGALYGYRLAVQIDGCAQEQYEPLPPRPG
jgi:hypothetical protein